MTGAQPMLEGVKAAGRAAFHAHGAAGEDRHTFAPGSEHRHAFLCGYWAERFAAADRARLEGRPPMPQALTCQ